MANSDLKGSILVTCANGGLGSGVAAAIAATPEFADAYHGIYIVRNAASTPILDAAIEEGAKSGLRPHSRENIALDLSQLAQVREVAAAINARVAAGEIPRIRAIVLNAGFEEYETQSWTKEGLDVTFTINYLSHWLLTLLLLQSMDREHGRAVWISSWSHNPKDSHNKNTSAYALDHHRTMIPDDLEPIAKGTWSSNKDDSSIWAAGYRRYGVSKLCGVSMIYELQRRLDQDPDLNKISVLALDPGFMRTGISRRSHNWFVRVLITQFVPWLMSAIWSPIYPNGMFRTVKKSGRDVMAAAVDCGPSPLSEHPKSVYLNGSERGLENEEARDPRKNKTIWDGSVRYAHLEEGDTALKNWK